MSKYKPVVGERFGSYVVISDKVSSRRGYASVQVRCDCGTERYVDAYSLYQGKMNRCYKCNKRSGEENGRWKGYKDIPGTLWTRLKRHAKHRGMKVEIDMQDIWSKFIAQDRKCALSGRDISFIDGTASVDRIDSNKWYSADNIQIVHKDVNLMKNWFDQNYFIKMCADIAAINNVVIK